VKFDEVSSDLLTEAIAIYLGIAYPEGGVTDVVAERTRLAPGRRGANVLGDERFERVPCGAEVADAQRFNLRLGNARYLHMKLGIDRVSDSDEYVLVVDTHDTHFAEMIQQTEQAEYRQLLDRNQQIRETIEKAWTEAGLPTFEHYLRSRLAGLQNRRKTENES
jgi:hypothetical protein